MNVEKEFSDNLNTLGARTIISEKDGKITSSTKIHKFSAAEEEKQNNIKPTIIMVNCVFLMGQSNQPVEVKIPVGVKAMIHAVDNNELINHIVDSISNKGLFHNLIRYTTGEMLSLADIIFGISKMKKTISNSRDSEVARWADAIDHRKRLNKLSKASLHKKPYMPNVSIVISMDDINSIDRLTGYNLFKDTHRAVKFINDNFLLSFVIADDADECAYILYDGHTSYEEYPYKYLKREKDRSNDMTASIIKALALR